MRSMDVIFIIVLIGFLVVSIRLLSLKREIKKMTRQVQRHNQRVSDKKLDMALIDQDLEELGTEVNGLIDRLITEQQKRIRFEKEQKQMIASISHDLRTPLTSILGYLQLAVNGTIPFAEIKDILAIAIKQAKRFETLLNDFFELSVIESPDYELRLERVNLKTILIETLIGFYDRFQEKKIEPVIQIPENDIYVIANHQALTRVIENLLTNAITHSNGNVSIILEEHEKTAQLIIKNGAPSLTEIDVSRMFDRFYMADQARLGKSTGLGLSIVKNFMKKMNGSVTASLKSKQLSMVCEWRKI